MHDVVTLEETKLYLRVDHDFEDTTIAILIAAATEAALDYADAHDPLLAEPSARLKLAILTHVARAFSEREDGADTPASSVRLMQPLRDLEI